MFGGMKALTGWCCGPSIIDRTSYGPAISAFNPDDVGVLNPAPTIPLLYYDSDHMTLGAWSSTKANAVYGMTTEIHGVVFLDGTRSVLFVGRHGLGNPCYGRTTQNAALIGKVDGNGVRYCAIGPDGPYGMHAAPYRYQVWAYDALDLVKVKGGGLKALAAATVRGLGTAGAHPWYRNRPPRRSLQPEHRTDFCLSAKRRRPVHSHLRLPASSVTCLEPVREEHFSE